MKTEIEIHETETENNCIHIISQCCM